MTVLEKYKKFALPASLLIVCIIAFSSSFYFWRQTVLLKSNPQEASEKEVKDIIRKVEEFLILPEGETPTLATVTDPEKLKDQPFFMKAQKGDKVLIFTNAKKAILYRPSEQKIVEVAPLNIGQ